MSSNSPREKKYFERKKIYRLHTYTDIQGYILIPNVASSIARGGNYFVCTKSQVFRSAVVALFRLAL